MNSLLTQNSILRLMENASAPCLSIFMTTHTRGPEIRQDAIRLKNLLADAESRLRGLGLERAASESLLRPLRALLNQALFWRHQSEGLALFRSLPHFRHFCLPYPFEELVVAAERFHIKPLLHLLEEDGRFYVLALQQEGSTLFQGAASGMREVDLWPAEETERGKGGMPAAKVRMPGAALSPTGGRRGRIYAGDAEDLELTKESVLNYYRGIDGRLGRILAGERAPLILAGPDRLLSLYAEVNSYPHRMEEMIVGNPDPLSVEALHQRSLKLAREFFGKIRKAALERYAAMAGTGRTSERVEEIVSAAVHGRVDTLFVGIGLHRWGKVAAGTGVCTIHERQEDGDRDLLNFAAIETLERSGTVYAIEPRQMPAGGPAAAVLRY